MRLAGLVILYQPSSTIIDNIKSYLPLLDKLIVFDNTEAANENIHNQILELQNVILVHDNQNAGIAKRLNEGAAMCLNENFTWMLTMDQDSAFESNLFKEYVNCLEQLENKGNIAMTGVEFEVTPASNGCNCNEVKQVITSGSFINLALFKEIGGFDKALFIDEVDTDYCYQAILKGYKIIKFKSIFLNHSLGKVSYHKSLKTLKTTSRTLHSPLRLYYMVRNNLYLNSKYPQSIFHDETIRRKKDLLHRIKNNFLYGHNKLTLIQLVILGWLDFRKKKMGKKL